MTTKIESHVDGALERRPEMFKGKAKFEALLTILATPAQALEDALWQLFTERFLSAAVGVQLDVLGALVGQSRNGMSDEMYRLYIRARILANSSDGLGDDAIAIVRQALDDADAEVVLEAQFPASFVIKVEGVAVAAVYSAAIAELLRAGASAGVRAILETSASEPEDTFVFPTERAVEWENLVNVTAVGDRNSPYNPLDSVPVYRLSLNRTVQVYDMKSFSPLFIPFYGHLFRDIGKYGLIAHATLFEPYTSAPL